MHFQRQLLKFENLKPIVRVGLANPQSVAVKYHLIENLEQNSSTCENANGYCIITLEALSNALVISRNATTVTVSKMYRY
jgi:hypothetical protein